MTKIKNIIGVYIILNNINNKVYIGQSRNIKRRWREHRKKNLKGILYDDIRTYGLENFSFSLLVEIDDSEKTQELLDYYEKLYILKYNSTNEDEGYNIASGGLKYNCAERTKKILRKKLIGVNKGKKRSIEFKNKMRKIALERDYSHYNGKHPSMETKEKIRKAHLGKKASKETKEKMSKARKGIKFSEEHSKHKSEAQMGNKNPMYGRTGSNCPNSKKIICIETNRIYSSITEASKELNINGGNIGACCRGKLKSCGGYHWKYV